MRKITSYMLPPGLEINVPMPSGAEILGVSVVARMTDKGPDVRPVLMAIVETDNPVVSHPLWIVPHQQAIPISVLKENFLGSFQVGEGIWHVFKVAHVPNQN